MSGQQPNFNPGAFEFRPGQVPFVPRGQQQAQQQQAQGQYAQYGQQGAYDPYAQYGQQGQQQGGAYNPYAQYGGGGGYQQQQAYGGQYGQGYGGYQQQPAQEEPAQRAFVPGQRSVFVPPTQSKAPRTVEGFKPPTIKADSSKAPSLSIGGSKPAPSLSIGGAPKAAPSLSIGGGAPKAAPSLSIGGAKAAPSLSIGGAKKDEAPKEDKKEVKEEPKAAAAPAPASAATPAPVAAAAAAPVAEETKPAPAVEEKKAAESTPAETKDTEEKKAASGTNFTKVSAKNDADAVLKEQEAAGEEALQELYGDIVDPNAKSHLNIIFTGHVDAGKSTMGGQLLYLTGAVDKRTMEKYEQEAKAAGRETWYLSWALDSNKEERAKGKTVEVGRAYFESEKRRYTILDAPGHKTYVPSMITGAAQADVAMLVLSARKGEFETGFERDGQTREHAMLIKNNGINKLVLLVNKMDDPTVQWDQGRFDEIKTKITPFLKALGFNPKTDLTFIPVSAQMGQNMKEPIGKMAPWYEGPSLLNFLDNVKIENRNNAAPFMLPVSEKYNELGTMVMGKVESGYVKKGDSLLVMPNRSSVEVAGIYTDQGDEMDQAFCGDNVRIRLKGITDEDVMPGYVITSKKAPVKTATAFKADISVIDTKNIISSGYSCVLHVHTAAEEVTISALLHYYSKGLPRRKSKKAPTHLRKGMLANVLIETAAPICIETFASYATLGRFTLRDEGKTVAIGKVTKILERDEMPDLSKLSVAK